MRQRPTRILALRLAYFLGALLMVAMMLGCGAINTVTPPSLDPANIYIQFTIKDLDITSPTVSVFAALHFTDTHLDAVHFRHGETLTCNQIQLNGGGTGYLADVPRVALLGEYRLTYTWQGGRSTITLPAFARPILSQPANGSTVSLSSISGSPKLLTLVTRRDDTDTYLQARAADGVGHIHTSSGVDATTIDVDGFVPSEGTISLTETYLNVSGYTDFAAASFEYDSVTTYSVRWAA